MELEEKKVSKFSAGLNIIQRLNNLWLNCQEYKRRGQYSKWNEELDTVWLELARDLEEDAYLDSKDEKSGKEIEGYKTKFEKFDENLKKELPFNDALLGFEKPGKEIFKRRSNQYDLLMEKQFFLTRLENEIGKGTSWGESEDDWD